jgi:hypothetical protein
LRLEGACDYLQIIDGFAGEQHSEAEKDSEHQAYWVRDVAEIHYADEMIPNRAEVTDVEDRNDRKRDQRNYRPILCKVV